MTQPTITFTSPELVDDSVEIQDFTLKKKRIGFRIDDDVFYASTVLSLPTMQNIIKLSKDLHGIVERENFEEIHKIFSEILIPDSAARFNERLALKGDEGIDVQRQLLPILHWLLEKFGLRPTQSSSDSSTGLPGGNGGITSTAGYSLEASTSTT